MFDFFKCKVDQLSIVVRWISIRDEISIQETFLGFVLMSFGKAEAVSQLAISTLETLGITLNKLRGQVYCTAIKANLNN